MNNTEKYAGSVTIFDDGGNIVFERNMSGDEMVEELLKKITDQAVAGALTGAATTIHAGNVHEVFSTVKNKLTTKYPKTPGSGKIKIPKTSKPAAGGGQHSSNYRSGKRRTEGRRDRKAAQGINRNGIHHQEPGKESRTTQSTTEASSH